MRYSLPIGTDRFVVQIEMETGRAAGQAGHGRPKM